MNVTIEQLEIKRIDKYPGRPTIVFLHDSLGCIELWRDFPQKLAEKVQCNVFIYDRLGYGRSAPMESHYRPVNYMEEEADVLNRLLQTSGIETPILFGHSDGGTIALLAAAKYPDQVKAVIAEAAHIFVEDLTLQGIRQAIENYNSTNLPERLAKYHGQKAETLFRAWTETWTRGDYRDWNIEDHLPRIICPLLFIQGEADEYGTLAQLEKTISGVSGAAERYILPDIGHSPHKEAGDLVLGKVAAFIRKVIQDL